MHVKKRFSLFSLIVTGAACVVLGLLLAALALALRVGGLGMLLKGEKFAAILNIIDKNYIGEYDLDEISEAGYSALLDAVDDRWSYYLTAEEYEAYKQYVANEYEGIGVTITKDEATGYLTVESVSSGSPAERAGVEPGDMLTSVAGRSVADMSVSEVSELIGGQEGSFELGLLRSDGTETVVTLKLGTVFSDPVSYEMLDGNIAYIALANFEAGAAAGAAAALEELRGRGAESVIFDVRSNPGGRVSELVELLDLLLPKGDLFVNVDREGREKVETSGPDCVDIPMAVLINGSSYSAAEFFAAALKEYGAAVTAGSPTTGKGRSQITLTLADGSAVHISSKKYLTPNRVDLSETGGLIPDIAVEPEEGRDSQLEAAAEYLRTEAAA